MKTKEQKLAQVDELIKCLDIPREEVIKHLQLTSMTNVSAIEVLSKTNNPNIKPGMFWYEDDTFSFYRITGKKIKAIVELVENDVIYGGVCRLSYIIYAVTAISFVKIMPSRTFSLMCPKVH